MAARWHTAPAGAEGYVRDAGPALLRFARTLTLNDADAQDLVQDTLVKVIVHWERVARSDRIDRYVRRTMVNTFLSARRLAGARTVVSDLAVARAMARTPSPESDVGDRLLADVLLATLDARSRSVLVLRYLEDLPDEAIADILEISSGNVRVIAHRALNRLRPLLNDEPVVS